MREYWQTCENCSLSFNVFVLYLHQALKTKHVYNHDITLFQHHHVKNVGKLTLSHVKKRR